MTPLDLLTRPRVLVAWMLGAFLVTFLVTRAVTKAIRRGRGPFRDTSVGGVHVHHQVYGIFLLLGAGTAEFTYRPAAPWADVLAVLFGIGAALTLDEFALWLHLDDVYWAREGRSSVDAVLVAFVVGLLLLVGFNPFDDDAEVGEGPARGVGRDQSGVGAAGRPQRPSAARGDRHVRPAAGDVRGAPAGPADVLVGPPPLRRPPAGPGAAPLPTRPAHLAGPPGRRVRGRHRGPAATVPCSSGLYRTADPLIVKR